ncbi:hypothetical protein FDE29_24020 [Vibrio parahaemolyticus]|nr:hypothetical protein [Vibrio parahaemolyticus]EGR0439584.1 hypothetical protein [Vibrio parahaemolyticus]EGR0766557.1 hypothetical protein [Vibrio parahaemolyticus]EGR2568472.1 hypothetical protein [Vibrio parahaemolyticus]EGR3330515.1 hypothetical protein [Vibrio parahaemolyticus]EHK9610697.1 hypothetical protein [Vibrio parahaemolyticus]
MLVDVTQDGSGFASYDNEIVSGFLTGFVETCSVYVFYGDKGYCIAHDTGQIRISDIVSMAKKCGNIKSAYYCTNENVITAHMKSLHKERRGKLKNLIKPKNGIKKCDLPQGNLAVLKSGEVLSEDKDILALKVDQTSDPEKEKRKCINIVNNLFHPTNQQSIPLDVQYSNGECFTELPQVLYSLEYMEKIASSKALAGDNDFKHTLDRAKLLKVIG